MTLGIAEAAERTSSSNWGAGDASSNSANGFRSCRQALKMITGEAQSAAQSSAAAFLVHRAIEMPTNANAEVIASHSSAFQLPCGPGTRQPMIGRRFVLLL